MNKLRNLKPELFFAATAMVFGLIFLVATPPFQGGDEPLHFYRAYQVSTFNFIVDRNNGDDYGGILPRSLQETVALTTNNSSLGNLAPTEKYSFHTTLKSLSIKLDPSRKGWINFTATALYPPVAYAPQAVGVLIGRVLGLPPIVLLYFGRLANLITWVGLFFVAIKLIPRQKWAVAFIGLLPISLSQAASLSADTMTIGLSAAFLASILLLRERAKQISKLEIAGLFLIMSTMALCKQIMIVLLPLVLLIPHKAFKSKRHSYIVKLALIVLAVLLYVGWLYTIRNLDLKSVFSHHQNPAQQIHLILHRPLHFLKVLWNTYFFSFGDSITRSFIGTFGWGDTGLSEAIVTVGYIGLFLILSLSPDTRVVPWLSSRQKLLVAAIGALYWMAVSAALYAYYNPVGAAAIGGLQGRYFLPLPLLAIPLCYGNWLKSSKRVYAAVAVVIPLFLLLASVVAIYYRYYVPA